MTTYFVHLECNLSNKKSKQCQRKTDNWHSVSTQQPNGTSECMSTGGSEWGRDIEWGWREGKQIERQMRKRYTRQWVTVLSSHAFKKEPKSFLAGTPLLYLSVPQAKLLSNVHIALQGTVALRVRNNTVIEEDTRTTIICLLAGVWEQQ